jgi:hypothetical protein
MFGEYALVVTGTSSAATSWAGPWAHVALRALMVSPTWALAPRSVWAPVVGAVGLGLAGLSAVAVIRRRGGRPKGTQVGPIDVTS